MTVGPTITLQDGTKVPQVAFGVGALSKTSFDQSFVDKINLAIKAGYRHFDGAERYMSDEEIGVAISTSTIPRSEFFITDKVHSLGGIKSGDIEGTLRKSLKDLKTDYVDLYLIHNPLFPEGSMGIEEAWRQMESVKEKGLARNIGISNFETVDIEKVLKIARVKPAVNQIELHPYIWKESQQVLETCKKHGIQIASYSPLMPIARHPSGPLPPLLESIASKHKISTAQVLLKWQAQKGHILITSSSNPERIANQIELGGFELSEEDVRAIEEEGSKYNFRFFGWGTFAKEYKSVL